MARSTARRVVGWALAVETLTLVVFVVTIRSRNGGVAGIALVVVAFAAWYLLAERLPELDGDTRMMRWLLAAMAVVLLAMVVMPSRQSDDAFLYGIYGRMVSVHHANPWRTVPADVRGDAIERFVGQHWVRTPSYYGPVWISWAALGTWLVPATKLAIRLLFQITSAALVSAIGWLLWRLTRSIAAVATFVLQPLVVLSVVNGGHNDGAVALLCLAAVLVLVSRDGASAPAHPAGPARPVLAGVLFGLAGLVKATALLGAAGAVLWLGVARRRRDAGSVAAVAGGMTALGFVAAPGSIAALRSAATETSFLSFWQTVRSALHPTLLLHGGVWGPEDFGAARAAPFLAAVAVVAVLVWLRPAIERGAIGIEWAVAAGLTSYLVLGAWVQPWHLVWAFPLVVLAASAVLRRAAALHAAVVLALFQAEDWIRSDLWRPLRVVVIVAVPLGIVAIYGYAVTGARRSARAGQRAPTGRPSMI